MSLKERSPPYLWERLLLWAFIAVCFGIDAAGRVAPLVVASFP